MAENKTKPTNASVASYFAAIEDEGRRKDCEALAKLMTRATKEKPRMWGTSIVGFGSYHYRYDSGREGDMCIVGFSSRKGDISLYPHRRLRRTRCAARAARQAQGREGVPVRAQDERRRSQGPQAARRGGVRGPEASPRLRRT